MQKQNSMDVIKVRCKANASELISLEDFLSESSPYNLTPEELEVRKALQFLYDMNDKDPPLFKSFPDWREGQPLIIDCTTVPKGKKTEAEFVHKENMITFKKSLMSVSLVGCLAHELKHAEQCGKTVYDVRTGEIDTDNLSVQQIGLLGEAQSYIFENYVKMLFFEKEEGVSDQDLRKKMESKGDLATPIVLDKMMAWRKEEPCVLEKIDAHKNYKKLEQELIPSVLDVLYESEYQKDYEKECPAHEGDKGIPTLPQEFGLEEEYGSSLLQGKLQEIPRDKLTSDDYSSAQEKDKQRILRKILSQEFKGSGNGFLDDVDYCILVKNSYQDGDLSGMMALLKKRNKRGESWVLNEDKMDAMHWFIAYHSMDEALEMVKKAQEEPAVFNKEELEEVFKDKRFADPQIQAALKNDQKHGNISANQRKVILLRQNQP